MKSGPALNPLGNLRRYSHKQPWVPLFLKFIERMRIDSKELVAEDDSGSPFVLWDSQRRFLDGVLAGMEQGQRKFYCLKSRQLGITTITLALDLFWLAVHPRTIGCLVADNEKNMLAFRDTIKRYLASFPPKFFGDGFRVVKNNETMLAFSNGSRLDYLVAGQRSKTWGESRSYSYAHLTEIAKYGKEEGILSFFEGLAQGNPDQLYLVESTASGMNHWCKLWRDAERDPGIGRVFIGWWANPMNRYERGSPIFRQFAEHDVTGEEHKLCEEVRLRFGHIITVEQLAWIRYRQSNTGADDLEQSQPWTPEQAFVMTGYTFFPARMIGNRLDEVLDEYNQFFWFKAYKVFMANNFWATYLEQVIDGERLADIELRVWEEPVVGGIYAIGCDPSYGHSDTADSHCVSVWRAYADKLVQVAEYCDHRVETHHCAWVLAGLAGAYKNCMVNLELAGPGRAVMREFENLRSQLKADIYRPASERRHWDEEFMGGARWHIERKIDSPGPGYLFNFETNWRNKIRLLNHFRDSFTTQTLEIRSAGLLDEMSTMRQEKSDIAPEASGSNHDDRVFAAALANLTYVEHLQAALVSEGATYERVSRSEDGVPDGRRDMVDRLVYDFFRRAEENAEEEMGDPWMHARGLV